MKLPRGLSGTELIKRLRVLGHNIDRQRGSHVRVTTQLGGEHHEAIPNHHPLKVGTLSGIFRSIAAHHGLTVEELVHKLDL